MTDTPPSEVCEPLEAHLQRICAAARQRIAMHTPNQHLSRKWQRQIRSFYPALLKEAAAADEPLDVVLANRSTESAMRVGKYCVRHFETQALQHALMQLDGRQQHPEDLMVLLLRMQLAIDRLQQADRARVALLPRRRSRAAHIQLLPSGWQQLMIERAPRKLRIALLMLQITGCRSCEIERGIDFEIGGAGAEVRLTLDVAGAKCAEYSGQRLRTFQFLAEDSRPVLTDLIACLTAMQSNAATASARFRLAEVSRRVCYLARELWPERDKRPSAYSFRYAFREEMALRGASRFEIARAMGHQSTDSALWYGRQISRARAQDFSMEISASVEPRYPHHDSSFIDQRYGSTGELRRAMTRELAHDFHQMQQL